MPPVSEAQRRWAFANRNKRSAEGRAAADYAAADPGGKLPPRAPKAKNPGRSLQSLVRKGKPK